MALKYDAKRRAWRVVIDTQKDGKRVNHQKSGFKIKDDAKSYERDFLNLLKITTIQELDMTVEDVLKEFFKHVRPSIRLSTFSKKKTFLEKYLIDDDALEIKGEFVDFKSRFSKKKLMKEITSSEIRDWKSELSNIDHNLLSTSYKNQILGAVRELFVFSDREFKNIHSKVYASSLENNIINEDELYKRNVVWSQDNFNDFLKTFDMEDLEEAAWYTLFLTLWTCHLRLGEVLGLRVMDYNGKSLRIDQIVVNGHGDGWRATKPKTKNSRRSFPIDSKANQYLYFYTDFMREKKGSNFDNSDFLFFFEKNPIGRTRFRRKFYDHIKKANLAGANIPKITIHDLRSSSAIAWIDQAGNTRDNMLRLQRKMGHSDLQTTINFYLSRSAKIDEDFEDLDKGFENLETSDYNILQEGFSEIIDSEFNPFKKD